jgi:hypothetical protein
MVNHHDRTTSGGLAYLREGFHDLPGISGAVLFYALSHHGVSVENHEAHPFGFYEATKSLNMKRISELWGGVELWKKKILRKVLFVSVAPSFRTISQGREPFGGNI